MVPSRTIEELGRCLLAEIGLDRPHVIADGSYGRVAIPYAKREIEGPWPTTTPEELYVLAHELGHWHLHTELMPRGRWQWLELPISRMEYDAEQYAHRRLSELGIDVPASMMETALNMLARFQRDRPAASDLLVGFVESFAPPETEVEILVRTARGRRWIEHVSTASRKPVAGRSDLYALPIEAMVSVARASAERRLVVQRV